jgi:YHS domain-containing protein
MLLLKRIAQEQGRSVVIVSHDQRIKEMAAMATDPVCGMAIEREKAVMADWNGQTYHFCSRGCRSEFLEEPQQFLNAVPQ